MDPEMIVLECEEHMDKSLEYLRNELRGVRTGRATTGLIEFVKVDVYGAPTELRNVAALSTPEPTQIVVKPFDPATIGDIIKGIERADLGLNPMSDGKTIRVPIPALSGDRRKQLAGQVKTLGENAKIAIRNARRESNKHVDHAEKDKDAHVSEDEAKKMKEEIQELTKKAESKIDELITSKAAEIMDL